MLVGAARTRAGNGAVIAICSGASSVNSRDSAAAGPAPINATANRPTQSAPAIRLTPQPKDNLGTGWGALEGGHNVVLDTRAPP